MRLVTPSILALIGACAAPGPSEYQGSFTHLPAEPIELDWTSLEVEINGAGPFPFGFDTGQSVPVIVTPALAEQLDLQPVSQAPVGDGSRENERTVDIVTIESLTFGGATFRDVTGVVLQTADQGPDVPGGALGFPLFEEVLLTVKGDRLRLEDGELPAPDGGEVLAYTAPHNLPTIEIELAGQPVRALLDSANPKFLSLPIALADELPLAGEPVVVGRMATLFNEFDVLGAELAGDLAIGPHRFAAPALEFNGVLPDANVGRALTGLLSVTFDQRNQRVRMRPRRLAPTTPSNAPTLVPVGRADFRADVAGWRSDDRWIRQHEDCLALATRGDADLVLLGDSITQSFGGPGRDVWSPGDTARRERLEGYRVANLGISGDRTQHVLWRIQQGTLDGLHPRYVALMIGTNNLTAGDAPPEIAAGVERIVERVLALLPDAHVLVQGVFPRGKRDDPMRAQVRELNALLARLEPRPRVTFRDFRERFLESEGSPRVDLYASDFLHLSPAGYYAWGEALQQTLDAINAGEAAAVVR
ncbi:MAG: GDSL-type esterase/lipase family protein [Planctomycetota bacterium]